MTMIQVFEWIKKVMRSCKTHAQLNNTSKLIERFRRLFPDEWEYVSCLYDYKAGLRSRVNFSMYGKRE
jgi:hypothetical protein